MKDVICTVITKNYGHYALALHDSLLTHGNNEFFCVFVSDGMLPSDIIEQFKSREKVLFLYENDFENNELAIQLKDKYFLNYHDAYRWSMKPILMTYLLENAFNRVLYVDSDVFFYNSFKFLFEELNTHSILLSPHWRSSDPKIDIDNFKLNFLDGIYNGGFVVASKKGILALTYWAKLCLHNCEANRNEGYYVDQRYLDILPTRFDGIGNIKHKGCNVANWNQVDCKRTLQANGEVLINDNWPIVFIHFTNSMLKGILLGNDTLLAPFLEAYKQTLLKYDKVNIIEAFNKKGRFKSSRKDVSELEKKKNNKTLLKRILNKVKS